MRNWGTLAIVTIVTIVATGCLKLDPKGGVVEKGRFSSSSLLNDSTPVPVASDPAPGNLTLKIDETTLSLAQPASPRGDFGRIPHALNDSMTVFPAGAQPGAMKMIGQSLVVHSNYGLLVSNDRGVTWTVRNSRNGLPSDTVYDSLQVNGKLFVALNEGVAVSSNGGIDFEMLPILPTRNIPFDNPNASPLPVVSRIRAIQGEIRVWHSRGFLVSSDGGETFVSRTSNIPNSSIESVGQDLISVNNGISYSTDGGLTWTQATYPQVQWRSSWEGPNIAVSGDRVYVATGSQLLISTDRGRTFTAKGGEAQGLGADVNAVVVAQEKVYVSGVVGGLSVSQDGLNFTKLSFPSSLQASAVVAQQMTYNSATGDLYFLPKETSVRTDLFALQSDGTFRRTAGAVYQLLTGVLKDFNYFFSHASGLYISTNEGIVHSTDGGKTFSETNIEVCFNGCFHDNTNRIQTAVIVDNRMIVATLAGLYYNDNFNPAQARSQRQWGKVSTAQGLGSDTVRCANGFQNYVMACTDGGFSISSDGGASFSTRTTLNGLVMNPVSRFLAYGMNWFLAHPGGVSVSNDGASTFRKLDLPASLSNAGVNEVLRLANGQIYVLTSGGFAWSADDGATWTVPRISLNGTSGEMTQIGRGANGAVQIGSRIYVGTMYGVAFSDDNGATFDITRNGLGELAVLRMGTDGTSLYVSTQRGVYKMLRAPVAKKSN